MVMEEVIGDFNFVQPLKCVHTQNIAHELLIIFWDSWWSQIHIPIGI